MTVLAQIKELLATEGIAYDIAEHAPVRTSEEAAKVRNTDASIGAKALIFYADAKPILIVLPGNKRVDTKKFKHAFAVKDLRMASKEEVLQLTGLEVGSIPPLGKVLNLHSYYDNLLKTHEQAAFNAGELTVSIILRAEDLIRIENPEFGDIVTE